MSNHPLTIQDNGQIIGRTEILQALPSALDAASRLKVSQPAGILDTKNVSSRNRSQWHEPISGVILEHGAVTGGPFQVSEEIRGTLPTGFFAIGTITEVNSGNLVIDCDHNDFQVGDTITGQTSGATATLTSTNTGSDIQHDFNNASCVLKVGTRATDSAVRQSVRPAPYISGKGQDVTVTFKMPAQKTNVVCEVGALTDQDGIGIELTENDINIIFRATDRGADLKIPRSSWDDKLDGSRDRTTNPSGKTLDLTKATYFRIPFLWQGVGPVQCYFMIENEQILFYTHETANKDSQTYIRNPTLPIRVKIYNTGVTASPTQIEEYCATIASDGGYQLAGLEYSTPMDWSWTRSISARTPILAIRPKNEYPSGKPNIKTVRYLDAGAFIKTNDCIIQSAHIHDPVDIVATWNDIGGGSMVEYSIDITSVTGRPEHIVDLDAREAGGGTAKGSATILSGEFISLHSFLNANPFTGDSQMLVIYAIPRTGTADVTPHITWVESE